MVLTLIIASPSLWAASSCGRSMSCAASPGIIAGLVIPSEASLINTCETGSIMDNGSLISINYVMQKRRIVKNTSRRSFGRSPTSSELNQGSLGPSMGRLRIYKRYLFPSRCLYLEGIVPDSLLLHETISTEYTTSNNLSIVSHSHENSDTSNFPEPTVEFQSCRSRSWCSVRGKAIMCPLAWHFKCHDKA
jgi:hypothetical protein